LAFDAVANVLKEYLDILLKLLPFGFFYRLNDPVVSSFLLDLVKKLGLMLSRVLRAHHHLSSSLLLKFLLKHHLSLIKSGYTFVASLFAFLLEFSPRSFLFASRM